ncbi:MAG: radical SAM protein, partial [Boseongicola sp.]|nr:radical SAM protein [Boseongicola sp.]
LKLVPDLPRLRLSSIDSIEADPELLEVIATDSRFMPHLHLSLQSGDDMILKRMKRRHLRDDAIRFCREVRVLRPDMVFGADIIAGFPTETEEMFENSLKLVDECELTWLHVFPYSPRPGTPAARMPQVDGRTVRARAARLRAAGARAVTRHLDAQVGTTRTVLTEAPTMGRTEQFAVVRLSSAQPEGALIKARVSGHDGRELAGDPVKRVREAVNRPSGKDRCIGRKDCSEPRIAFAESET